jgi:hypothetical protein
MSQSSNNLPEFRSVTDAELEAVDGGHPAIVVFAAAIGACAALFISEGLGFEETVGEAAAALGAEHLL